MEPFLAQITIFAGNFAPRGWAFCDGQILQISQNQALFSLLGTTYGGDGRTTFGLPDLRGRAAVHEGDGPGLAPLRLGEKGGNENTTLNVGNLPPHSHTATVDNKLVVNASAEAQDTDDPAGGALAAGDFYRENATANQALAAGTIGGTLTVANANTGNGTAFSNRPPFLALNYIIALQGTYPSRS